MPFGAALSHLALTAPLPSRRLSFGWVWLAGWALCAGAIAILLAPDQIDRTDILIAGTAAPRAVTTLTDTLREADPALGITATATGLALTRRREVGLALHTGVPTLHGLAAATVAAIGAVLPGQAAPGVLDGQDRALLATERDAGEAALARAEADLARLSSALTDLARDQAQLLQQDGTQDGTPAPDPDNAPTRKLIADLQARRIDLAARYTADFPGIAITDQEITQLRALLAAPAKQGIGDMQKAHNTALTVLRAEQGRVGAEYSAAVARRNELEGRIGNLDQSLSAAPQVSLAPPLSMVVIDLPAETLPDRRSLPLGASAALALLGSLLPRPRRRRASGQIELLEQAIGLPVLTCLDAQGARLAFARGARPAIQDSRRKSLFASFSSEKEASF